MQSQRLSNEDLQHHARWLRRLALDLTRNEHAADDLVQDTFVAVLGHRKPLTASAGTTNPRAYLAGVLRNLYRMAVRTDVRRERREALSVDDARVAPAPDQVDEGQWARRILLEEVERLSEPFRTTLLLRYYDGLRSQEIAQRMGLPEATVRKRNQLALSRLRQRLDRRTGPQWRGAMPLAPLRWIWPRRKLAGSHVALATALVVGVLVMASNSLPLHFVAGAKAGVASPATSALSARDVPAFLTTEAELQTWAGPNTEKSSTKGDLDPILETLSLDEDPSLESDVSAAHAPQACGSLQNMIDLAAVGSIVQTPAHCIYREKVIVTKSVRLIAGAGAEIRGSDVWNDFVQRGSTWVSRQTVPVFPDESRDCDKRPSEPCHAPDQVFRNGEPLERVGHNVVPNGQQYSLNEHRQVVLGASPRGHQLEVTTRLGWLSVAAQDVVVSGFKMQHAASRHYGLAVINPSQRVSVRNNHFRHAAGTAASLAGESHSFENNVVEHTGFEALRLEPGSGAQVIGNEIRHAGQRHTAGSWQSGGILVLLHPKAKIFRNRVHHNQGMALLNIRSPNVIVSDNQLHDNWGGAIAYLGCQGGAISNNRAWSNGQHAIPPEPALFLTSTMGAEVAGNVFAHHPFGIYVGPTRRDHIPAGFDPCHDTANNLLHDNVIIAQDATGTRITLSGDPREDDAIAACASNRLERNKQWPAPSNAHAVALSAFEKDNHLAQMPR